MNIHKAFKRIDKLTDIELKRCIRQLKDDIINYKIMIINYSEEKMLKCGTPYLNKQNGMLSDFESTLKQL